MVYGSGLRCRSHIRPLVEGAKGRRPSKATFRRWWKGSRVVPIVKPHWAAGGRGRGPSVPIERGFPVIAALPIARYHAIGGSPLNNEVTSLYRGEAVTSDFDTAILGPFAIQDTAI